MHFRFILLLLPLHPHAQGKPAEAGLPDSLSVLLRRAGSDSARIAANLRIASAMEASDFRKALEHATRAVQLSEKSGNYTLQIESNLAAGGVAMRKGLYDLAVIHFTRQYDLVRQAGDDLESSKAYFNLGAVHLMLGEFAKARDIFIEADPMMQRGYRSKGLPIPDYNEVTLWMTGIVLNCTELSDASNVFASNEFTAPRDGFYMVTAMTSTDAKTWVAQSQFTLAFSSNSAAAVSTFNRVFTSGTRTLTASTASVFIATSISGVVYLTAGQKGRFELCCEAYTITGSTSYNYFSIAE